MATPELVPEFRISYFLSHVFVTLKNQTPAFSLAKNDRLLSLLIGFISNIERFNRTRHIPSQTSTVIPLRERDPIASRQTLSRGCVFSRLCGDSRERSIRLHGERLLQRHLSLRFESIDRGTHPDCRIALRRGTRT